MAANEMGKGAQALMVLAAAAIVAAAIKLAAAVVAPFLVAACIAVAVQPIFRWVHSSRIPDVSAVFISLLVVIGLLGRRGRAVGVGAREPERLRSSIRVVAAPRASAGFRLARGAPPARLGAIPVWLAPRHTLTRGDYLRADEPAHGHVRAAHSAFADRVHVAGSNDHAQAPARGARLVAPNIQRPLAHDGGDSALSEREDRDQCRHRVVRGDLWCAVCGVPNPALWGLVTFALHYVPTVGGLVAAMPPVFIALTAYGVGRAGVVAAGLATFSMIIGNIIEPKALGRSLSVSPLDCAGFDVRLGLAARADRRTALRAADLNREDRALEYE